MPLAFAAAANHAPGITSRRETATAVQQEVLFGAFERLKERMEAARLDALVAVSAEHFTNLFYNNAPPFCLGVAETHEGPSEDESFIKIAKTAVPGAADIAHHIARVAGETIDLAHSQELQLDHGIMVPLHLLTPEMRLPIVPLIVNCLMHPLPPLARCYALGQALRRALDARPERIGLLGCGGLSHWPATPESGRLNLEFDREFLDDFLAGDRARLTRYSDAEITELAGPGGHEIRSWIVVAGATAGCAGEALCFEPIPAYAVTGCIATAVLA